MNRNSIVRSTILLLFLSLIITFPGTLQAGKVSTKGAVKKIDSFLKNIYPANEPGAAVLVVKDGKTLLRKGYGMANLELNIPVRPEIVFRIGSITKQFTSVAVMKLMEDGKLKLTDDIKKFFPDYPTHGHKITVKHLLNHTSGIKNYTNMPEWLPQMRKDIKLTELIDFFKYQPMDFAPGERFRYTNSGYILLGAVIEKASGKNYETYIDETIFKPLGMKNSYYGDPSRIIPNRASGYKKDKKGFRNSDYLSMTQTYAAGSLLSTVDDLHRWYQALEAGKVISLKSLALMHEQTKLNSGRSLPYGFGWSLGKVFGENTYGHGGGINGFVSHALRIKEKDVFVTILTNSIYNEINPDFVVRWIAALLCGKPVKDRRAVSLDSKALNSVVGVYQIAEDDTRIVTREGNQLFTKRGRGRKLPVFPESETQFFYKNRFTHFTIVKDKTGKVIKMITYRESEKEEAQKISDNPPVEKKK